jgi:hypothetical protein
MAWFSRFMIRAEAADDADQLLQVILHEFDITCDESYTQEG